MKRFFSILTGVVMGGAVATVVIFAQNFRLGAEAEPSGVTEFASDPAPDFSLIAHDGRAVSLADFQGSVVALFFGFTHCPDICPITMAYFGRAMEALGKEADRVQVLFITVDPDRDTPEQLREYLGNFHPSFLGLTGSEEGLAEVASSNGALLHRRGIPTSEGEGHERHQGHAPPAPSGFYLVDHSGRAFVVDSHGRLAFTLLPHLDAPEVKEALAAALRRS